MVLGGDTVKVIWGHNPDRPRSKTHMHRHRHKGVRSLHFKEEGSGPKFSDAGQFKQWEIRANNVRLPNDDHTHYFCQIFKAPELEVKHHMVGFEPVIQDGHENYVHHMVLYECHVPTEGATSSDWFEAHVGGEGHACYSPNMPQEWSFCLATNAWAWVSNSLFS